MSTQLAEQPGGARKAVTSGLASARAAASRALGSLSAAARTFILPALTLIARPLRPVTALAWSLVAIVLAGLVVTLVWGWAESLAITVAALAALVIAVPFVIGRSAFAVRVELASPRVVVGERAVGRVVVRNTAARASAPVRIELPVGRDRAEFRLPRLAPGEEGDELFAIPTQRRAVLTLGPVTSVRADPLGILERSVAWSEPTELYVHPRTVSLASETTGFMRDLEGLPTRDLADDDVSFHALREYVPGDDLRNVHWRSTARAGRMMIRQFEQTRRSHLVVALSTRAADYADADEFELAVSCAASVGIAAIRADKALSVFTSSSHLQARTQSHFLDGCSGFETATGAPGLAEIGRAIAKDAAGASVVVFVTGSAADPTSARQGASRIPAAARASCLRTATAEPISRRVMGDVAMVSVPTLEVLRSAIRGLEG